MKNSAIKYYFSKLPSEQQLLTEEVKEKIKNLMKAV
jgi:hypothetical protein